MVVEWRHASAAVVLPSPTSNGAVRAGHRRKATAKTLAAPVIDSMLVRAEVPVDRHIVMSRDLDAPATTDVHSFPNFTTHGAGTLAPPSTYSQAESSFRSFLVLTTPAQQADFQFEPGSDLWGYLLEGLSVFRAFGEWQVGNVPVPDEVPGLEVFYRGGHRHVLTRAEADELSAAGFSDYIATEVR